MFVSFEVELSHILKISSLFTDEILTNNIGVGRNLKDISDGEPFISS